MSVSAILTLALALVLLYAIYAYNRLVEKRNQLNNGWAQLDVQLKRRTDLIPNLVETVQGYMDHERNLFESIAKARAAAVEAKTMIDRNAAENNLSRVLGQLFAVVENYPELKANESFMALQEELTSTENRIAYARQAYNDGVLSYNNQLQTFPSNLVASMGHFTSRPYLQITAKDREVPIVHFDRLSKS